MTSDRFATGRSARPDAFQSSGVSIRIERFDPEAPASDPCAAILLLHGADGPGEHFRRAAGLLAAAGWSVFLVHYLERTGERWASYASIGRNFPLWAATIRDALDWVAGQPDVDPERIGLLGVSLGGGLAVAAAGRDSRIPAVVVYFGFAPPGFGDAGALPPMLVLHGEKDPIVPVSNAHELGRVLRSRGTPHEIVVYPGQGHGFTGAAEIDAGRRTTAFFARHL